MFKIIGVMGGIASGKTAFTDVLVKAGEIVVDVDEINRKILQQHDVVRKVVKLFPEAAYMSFGELKCIDRKKLSSIVFSNAESMKQLKAIVDPLIHLEVNIALLKAAQAGKKFVFYSHPLLITSGEWHRCSEVVEIKCDEKVQIERLMKRNSLSEEEARNRIKLQYQGFHSGWPSDIMLLTPIRNYGTIEDLGLRAIEFVINLYRKY